MHAGIIFIYSAWQICVWMLLFAVILFWGVRFPFKYRQLKVNGTIRYIHIASVILAVFVPLLPTIAHLVDGYKISLDSPYACIGRDIRYNYYTFLLPLGILLTALSFILVFILWTIIKEFVLKKFLLKKKAVNVTRAELKMTVLISYSLMITVLLIILFVYLDKSNVEQDLLEFISCESMGIEADCNFDASYRKFSGMFTALLVMLDLVPVVILLISCKCDPQHWKYQLSSKIPCH